MKLFLSLCLYFLLFSLAAFEISYINFESLWGGKRVDSPTSIRLINKISDGPTFVQTKFDGPVDFTKKIIFFQLRVNDLKKLSGLEVRITSSENGHDNYIAINLPLFTDPEFNIVQSNEWSNHSFSLGEGRIKGKVDIKNINKMGIFFMSKNSSEASPLELEIKNIMVREGQGEGRISMTFDDGYKEQYEMAALMYKYGLTGTAYIMTNQLDKATYLTLDEVQTMKYVFDFEIGSHHFIPFTQMGKTQMNDELDKTFEKLASIGIFEDVFHFAYPLGKQSHQHTLPIIKHRLKSARVASGGAETLPPASWYYLRAYNITPDISPEEIIERMKKAKLNNEWLILMFHRFSDEIPKSDLTYNKKQFEKLCRLMFENNIKTYAIKNVYEEYKNEKFIN